jgi:hypothetical protein
VFGGPGFIRSQGRDRQGDGRMRQCFWGKSEKWDGSGSAALQ